jgi:hypothetical protein
VNRRTLPAMRRLLCLPVLLLAACGPEARVDPPAASDQRPAASSQSPAASDQRPAASQAPAEPIDERFATTRDGWRVDYHLRLPALPADTTKGLRRACTAWLFQGLAAPRPTLAESGEAALATLIADGGTPVGGEPWYSERAVVATLQGGGWLALRRSERSFAGGGSHAARVEGLIIDLDRALALTIDEVVPPERQEALRLHLARELRRVRGLPTDGPLTSVIASDAELPIPVPLLSADGARFVWNPNEIGPLSDGAYEATLAIGQVRGALAIDPWAMPREVGITPPPAP